jgi:hypothetical protein
MSVMPSALVGASLAAIAPSAAASVLGAGLAAG